MEKVHPSAAAYQELLIDNQWQLVHANGRLFNLKKIGGPLDIGQPLRFALGPLWNRDIKQMCADTMERGVSSSQVVEKKIRGVLLALSLGCRPSIVKGHVSGIALRIEDVTAGRRLAHQLDLRNRMKMIVQLASHVGHNMNNPIATMLNRIGGILIESEDVFDVAYLRRELQTIQEQLYGISIISTALAAFSNGTNKDYKLIQVNDVVQNALHLMRLVDSEHHIKFKTNLSKTLPRVLGSDVTLEQCLVNICKNSVEAMPDGGEIQISTQSDEQFPNFINITISDNGPGISPENQKHVFDPFFTTKKSHHGLGLCVSFAIASDHDGGLELWSQENRGTTVHIILPSANVEFN